MVSCGDRTATEKEKRREKKRLSTPESLVKAKKSEKDILKKSERGRSREVETYQKRGKTHRGRGPRNEGKGKLYWCGRTLASKAFENIVIDHTRKKKDGEFVESAERVKRG